MGRRRHRDIPISAADANRTFSELLRGVREGRSYVVTSHGKPVARISPYEGADLDRDAAKQRLLDHLRAQVPLHLGKFDRESLYEDGE
jgi:prevent-host-death family protein